MNRIIVGTALFIGIFIVAAIAFAYAFYFVGMAVSISTIGILGFEGEVLASIFAWIGVGIVILTALASVIIAVAKADVKPTIIEVDSDEMARILREMNNDKEER